MMVMVVVMVMMMMMVMVMKSNLGGMSVELTAAVGVERQHWTRNVFAFLQLWFDVFSSLRHHYDLMFFLALYVIIMTLCSYQELFT